MARLRSVVLVVLAAALTMGVSACTGSGAPSITPGPSARDAGCTSLLQRLPATLLGQAQESTRVAGAAVWGTTSPIILRCGVTPPGPSASPCLTVNGIDWLFVDGRSAYTLTLYGREPAAELSVPHEYGGAKASGATSILTEAVRPLTVTRQCVGLNPTGAP